jgi:hypothetical protein
MWLLPFERINMRSSRSADELVTALGRVTRPSNPIDIRPLLRPKETATFIGEVSKERLEIGRALTYRNSFAPLVLGRIVDSSSGARIEAVMRPHGFVLAFLAVFALAIGPGALASVARFVKRGMFDGFEWVPIVMLAGLYAGCMLGFLPEARRMKAILRDFTGPDITTLEPR